MTDARVRDERSAMLAHPPIRALLAGAIDYAGLFPPAALDLATVVANYGRYRVGDEAWALGRLVVPVARLDDLERAAGTRWREDALAGHAPWRISALVGNDVAADARRTAAFNQTHAPAAVVDCVEARARSVAEVEALGGLFDGVDLFVEVPLATELAPLISAIRGIRAHAKVRTGGVTADAFPDARDVARFLKACAEGGVSFKATAGLHHALRGEYRLTYAPDSPTGTMFGYFNIFLASAQAQTGASLEQLIRTLAGSNRAMLGIDDEEIRWEGGRASTEMMQRTRANFALAFGSCSFREPLDDLGTLHAE